MESQSDCLVEPFFFSFGKPISVLKCLNEFLVQWGLIVINPCVTNFAIFLAHSCFFDFLPYASLLNNKGGVELQLLNKREDCDN